MEAGTRWEPNLNRDCGFGRHQFFYNNSFSNVDTGRETGLLLSIKNNEIGYNVLYAKETDVE